MCIPSRFPKADISPANEPDISCANDIAREKY
jgi:hypothetical protein